MDRRASSRELVEGAVLAGLLLEAAVERGGREGLDRTLDLPRERRGRGCRVGGAEEGRAKEGEGVLLGKEREGLRGGVSVVRKKIEEAQLAIEI